MIKRKTQVITQPYKGESHRGVDLRSVSFVTWRRQSVVAPEDVTVMRFGYDGYGNGYVVYRGRETNLVMKSIHIEWSSLVAEGVIIKKGEEIGKTAMGGNSNAHHEHFETWSSDESKHFDPENYFKLMNVRYKYK